jgi:hypothetical protein
MYQIRDTTYLMNGAVLLEKLNVFQLVKKFPTFYRTQMFITTFLSLHDTTANINESKLCIINMQQKYTLS